MDIIFEFVFELIFQESIDSSKNKNFPKPLRFFLIFLIALVYVSVLGLAMWAGVCEILDKNIIEGIAIILMGLFISVVCILRFRKIYLERNK